MVKPVLIPVIPPVTLGGKTNPVVANWFDQSGFFRQRVPSFKRPRRDGGVDGGRDGVFDISREADFPSLPSAVRLDIDGIRGLLVRATEAALPIRSFLDSESGSVEPRELAVASIALLDLLAAVVERGICPLSSSATVPGSAVSGRVPPSLPSGPCVEPGESELRAEKTAVVFNADLGPSSVANRNVLNAAFATGLKKASDKVASEAGGDAAEGVRVVNDALSCVDNLEFLGQASVRGIDKSNPLNPTPLDYFTMPIKLDFPDRGTRIHFERTLRQSCGMKAYMSLPAKLREYKALFYKAIQARYPNKIVMVRPDAATLSLVAFTKSHGGSRWTQCPEIHEFPRGIMLSDFVVPNGITLQHPAGNTVGPTQGPPVAPQGAEAAEHLVH
jgi:hypothetical protein